jgi:crotonobetainyl-CoA:carnitine CoA-transferase CaiB-like acyl-CoA transferase
MAMTLTSPPDFAPLAGIHVLDFSHVIAGPFATFLLSQLGAEVTKVENAGGGDVMRRAGKGHAAFVALNAGKSSLALDLADAGGRGACAGTGQPLRCVRRQPAARRAGALRTGL